METKLKEKITIDIVSDVVCPWCYVGKKRLEAALKQLDHPEEIEVSWHPFQLDATIPAEGLDRKKYFLKKFGDESRIQSMFTHLTQVGQQEGIDFQLDTLPEVINTFPLHQLLCVAGQEGFQHEAHEVLFKAYFTEGKNLKDVRVLAELFAPFGWNEQRVNEILADTSVAAHVRQEMDHYQRMGVSGVPFFVVNNKYGISGAQPADVFLQALATVRQEMLQAR